MTRSPIPLISQPNARQLAIHMAVLASLVLSVPQVRADDRRTLSLAEQEVQRRSAYIATQQEKIREAESLYKDKKAQEAYDLYLAIFNSLPQVPLAEEVRAMALDGCLRAGTMRARELMDGGDYPASRRILDTLDSPKLAKGNRQVARLRARMEDPDRYPPALTPEHVDKVAEVKRLLILASSQRETGQYDKALKTFEEVLHLDPYNTAARRGMEGTEQDRARYFEAAKDHSRAKMLGVVDQAWENPVPMSNISSLFGAGGPAAGTSASRGGRSAILAKLRDLKFERIDFTDAVLDEVIEYLRVRSRDVDPSGKGVDFVIGVPKEQPTKAVSLNLVNVPLEEVLRYVTEVAGVGYRVEDFAVRITSLSEAGDTVLTKTYKVPPDFIASAPVGPAPGAAAVDPFATNTPVAASGLIVRRLGAKEFLESRGINFGPDSGASYSPSTNILTVRNTARNMELVDLLVDQSLNSSPKQVVVEVKILEVNQNNLEELGFDWLLGSFGTAVELMGGTQGNQGTGNFLTNDFPNQITLPNGRSTGFGQNPVTAGLRSSGDLVATQTIEDVLYGAVTPASRRSPGLFSLSGVLTNPEFQMVVRALDQKTGVDLVVKPEVVTKSGQKATVEIVREFIYPTEFDPPQVPTNVGGTTNRNVILIGPTRLPPAVATPATPTAFDMRRVGVTLDVEPVISEDGRTVDLTLTPVLTDFIGFVNYGSPIRTVDPTGAGAPIDITENRIFQPIFSTKKVATAVKVYDGATVVLGGLISDNSVVLDDKIPVAGDLPLVGRFFRSKVTQRRSKNMIFFVTVKVIDPAGNRILRTQ